MSENSESNINIGENNGEVRDYTFIQNLLLLCLGSLFFASIIEGYKSDLTSDKNLIKEYYRPLRDTASTCTPLHNQLFLKHAELAGSYQLMFDEVGYMFKNPKRANNPNYQLYPMSVFKVNSELKLELKKLGQKVVKCRVKVYQKYEELALATGSYEKYKELSKAHFKVLNEGHKAKKDATPQKIKAMDPNHLVQLMRELTTLDLSTGEKKSAFMNKLNDIANPVIEYEFVKMESEEMAFKENLRFHQEVTKIFLDEISSRNAPSLISHLF